MIGVGEGIAIAGVTTSAVAFTFKYGNPFRAKARDAIHVETISAQKEAIDAFESRATALAQKLEAAEQLTTTLQQNLDLALGKIAALELYAAPEAVRRFETVLDTHGQATNALLQELLARLVGVERTLKLDGGHGRTVPAPSAG